jgi:hypothetical protein
MKSVRVKGCEKVTRYLDVEVDPIEFLDSLKTSVCRVPSNAYLNRDTGVVETADDVSYHGSPVYDIHSYKDLSKPQIEIIDTVNKLKSLIRDVSRDD